LQPSGKSPNAAMSVSQRAARSPSVEYCSSSTESPGCPDKEDRSIANLRTLMDFEGPVTPMNQFGDIRGCGGIFSEFKYSQFP